MRWFYYLTKFLPAILHSEPCPDPWNSHSSSLTLSGSTASSSEINPVRVYNRGIRQTSLTTKTSKTTTSVQFPLISQTWNYSEAKKTSFEKSSYETGRQMLSATNPSTGLASAAPSKSHQASDSLSYSGAVPLDTHSTSRPVASHLAVSRGALPLATSQHVSPNSTSNSSAFPLYTHSTSRPVASHSAVSGGALPLPTSARVSPSSAGSMSAYKSKGKPPKESATSSPAQVSNPGQITASPPPKVTPLAQGCIGDGCPNPIETGCFGINCQPPPEGGNGTCVGPLCFDPKTKKCLWTTCIPCSGDGCTPCWGSMCNNGTGCVGIGCPPPPPQGGEGTCVGTVCFDPKTNKCLWTYCFPCSGSKCVPCWGTRCTPPGAGCVGIGCPPPPPKGDGNCVGPQCYSGTGTCLWSLCLPCSGLNCIPCWGLKCIPCLGLGECTPCLDGTCSDDDPNDESDGPSISSSFSNSRSSSTSSAVSAVTVTPIVDYYSPPITTALLTIAAEILYEQSLEACMTPVSGFSLSGTPCDIGNSNTSAPPNYTTPPVVSSSPLPISSTISAAATTTVSAVSPLTSAGNGHGNCSMILYGNGYYGPLNSTELLDCLSDYKYANWSVGENCAGVNWYKSSIQHTFKNATDCWIACVDCIADGIINGANNIACFNRVLDEDCEMGYDSGPPINKGGEWEHWLISTRHWASTRMKLG